MTQLSPEQYSQMSRVIDELAGANITGKPGQFVTDQVARKKQYGENIFLSPKQIKWLKDLHTEYIGDTDFDHDE